MHWELPVVVWCETGLAHNSPVVAASGPRLKAAVPGHGHGAGRRDQCAPAVPLPRVTAESVWPHPGGGGPEASPTHQEDDQ